MSYGNSKKHPKCKGFTLHIKSSLVISAKL